MMFFQEYEHQTSPEAIFVKDLDKFEMIFQAHEYEQLAKKPGSLQEFFDTTKGRKLSMIVDFVISYNTRGQQTSVEYIEKYNTVYTVKPHFIAPQFIAKLAYCHEIIKSRFLSM